jgi:hypothetical protein
MRAAGMKTYRLESIGQRMDWRLPNKPLSQVWGHAKQYVARLRRFPARKAKGTPGGRRRTGGGGERKRAKSAGRG